MWSLGIVWAYTVLPHPSNFVFLSQIQAYGMMATLLGMMPSKVNGRFSSLGVPRVGSFMVSRKALPCIAVGLWMRPGEAGRTSRDALWFHAKDIHKDEGWITCARLTSLNVVGSYRNRLDSVDAREFFVLDLMLALFYLILIIYSTS